MQVALRPDLRLRFVERHHGADWQHPVHFTTEAVVHAGVEAHRLEVLGLLEDVAPNLPRLAGRIALLQRQPEYLLPQYGAVGDVELDRLGGELFTPLFDVHRGGEGVATGTLERIMRRYVHLLGCADGGLDGEPPLHGWGVGDGGDLLSGF